jgi:thioredoxin reductase
MPPTVDAQDNKRRVACALPYDAVIIGGGPAGLSAALVLGRCVRRVVVCDSGRYRNERSPALHCFMSRDGIAPSSLMEETRRQLERYDTVSTLATEVTSVDGRGGQFAVVTDDGHELQARTVLVATGVVDEPPKVEGIDELFGRSVHVCPYCDGWEHRNAPVAVYGQGEKAVRFAILLRQWTDDLVLCTNGNRLSADHCGLLHKAGIGVREEAIARLEGKDGCLQAVSFVGGETLARTALFFTTGQHPRSPLLEKLGCRFDEEGGVACDADGRTSVPGVLVAGDVSRDVQLAIIAAAEGARAALAINRRLLEDGSYGTYLSRCH